MDLKHDGQQQAADPLLTKQSRRAGPIAWKWVGPSFVRRPGAPLVGWLVAWKSPFDAAAEGEKRGWSNVTAPKKKQTYVNGNATDRWFLIV